MLTRSRVYWQTDGQTTRKHNASGTLWGGGIKTNYKVKIAAMPEIFFLFFSNGFNHRQYKMMTACCISYHRAFHSCTFSIYNVKDSMKGGILDQTSNTSKWETQNEFHLPCQRMQTRWDCHACLPHPVICLWLGQSWFSDERKKAR